MAYLKQHIEKDNFEGCLKKEGNICTTTDCIIFALGALDEAFAAVSGNNAAETFEVAEKFKALLVRYLILKQGMEMDSIEEFDTFALESDIKSIFGEELLARLNT